MVCGFARSRFKQSQHEAAEDLLSVLTYLGPAFVKIGQALSSRPDVLAPEYLREMEKLQDQIPPFADEDAYKGVSANCECESGVHKPKGLSSACIILFNSIDVHMTVNGKIKGYQDSTVQLGVYATATKQLVHSSIMHFKQRIFCALYQWDCMHSHANSIFGSGCALEPL